MAGWRLSFGLGLVLAVGLQSRVHAQAWASVPEPPPLPPAEASGEVSSGGARIHYAAYHLGGPAPVVLLHGGLASSSSWGFEAPRLARRHAVILIDSRGHGRSTRPPGPLSYDQMVADTLAVMDWLHLPRVSIVGASDGGDVGLLLASRHPERVDRLLVWGANFTPDPSPPGPTDPRLVAAGKIYVARMAHDYRRVSPTPDGFPALRAELERLYAHEPNMTVEDLGKIRARTVVADGDHEQFVTRAHTEALARSIPRARLVILADVSHGGPLQNPAAFHHLVAELLDDRR